MTDMWTNKDIREATWVRRAERQNGYFIFDLIKGEDIITTTNIHKTTIANAGDEAAQKVLQNRILEDQRTQMLNHGQNAKV